MTAVKEKSNPVIVRLCLPHGGGGERKPGSGPGRQAHRGHPLVEGCEEARRTTVAHLGAYILSIRPETKPCFSSRPDDDSSVLERLRLIADFKGGGKRIIDRGLSLLALNMVSDCKRDIEEDERLGKYNPVAAGAWNSEEPVVDLEYKIACVECPEMEEILPIEMIPFSFWGW